MKKWMCVVAVIVFAACQKGIESFNGSGSSGTANIAGTWTFISFSGSYQSTAEYVENDSDYKNTTYINLDTKDNAGTYTFSNDSTYSTNNISYDLSYTAHNYNYKNGVLVDSNQIPASFPADSSHSTGNYELIGSDSIYFSSGFPFMLNTFTTSNGGRININGNTLTITQKMKTDSIIHNGGLSYPTTINTADTLILQKQ